MTVFDEISCVNQIYLTRTARERKSNIISISCKEIMFVYVELKLNNMILREKGKDEMKMSVRIREGN